MPQLAEGKKIINLSKCNYTKETVSVVNNFSKKKSLDPGGSQMPLWKSFKKRHYTKANIKAKNYSNCM